MEPLKQYVFMFVAGSQALGHCRVQCAGGSARIQVQVRLEASDDTPPLLAVFDTGGHAMMAGSLRRSGANFILAADIAWPAQAVCAGAAAVDPAGVILLSAGKLPYDAARTLQKAMGLLPGSGVQETHSPVSPQKPRPAPSPAVEAPAPFQPPPVMEARPVPPVMEEQPAPPPLEIRVEVEEPAPMAEEPPMQYAQPEPPTMPEGGSAQYWWQEPRCPYSEMPPPPDDIPQQGYDDMPEYMPPDMCDPSNRMQGGQSGFIPAQPRQGYDPGGFFSGMQQDDLPSGVVSCPAAALHQADPFHGSEFAGWSWCKVQYEGLHWHYLIGENKTGQGPYSRAVGVPGQYSLRPPPHLKGFDRFAVSRDGTGYWLYFEQGESGS